jgi:hypothetical protein
LVEQAAPVERSDLAFEMEETNIVLRDRGPADNLGAQELWRYTTSVRWRSHLEPGLRAPGVERVVVPHWRPVETRRRSKARERWRELFRRSSGC